MSNCYLCGADGEINGRDYGLRTGVHCSSCEDYVIDNAAIPKLQDSAFKQSRKEALRQRVIDIHKCGREAEIFFSENVLGVREMQDEAGL